MKDAGVSSVHIETFEEPDPPYFVDIDRDDGDDDGGQDKPAAPADRDPDGNALPPAPQVNHRIAKFAEN